MHAVPHISVIVFFIVAVSAVAITLIRIHFKNKLKKFSENLTHIPSYRDKSNAEPGCEGLEVLSIGNFIDIPTDLTNAFNGKIISSTQKRDFVNHYNPYFQEANALLNKLAVYKIYPPEILSSFIDDFKSIDSLVKRHNECVFEFLLSTHKEFFDHCLAYPLDSQQRRAIISEEDNCLVVSSAGSGKTSSIIGKVKYLTEIKKSDQKRFC